MVLSQKKICKINEMVKAGNGDRQIARELKIDHRSVGKYRKAIARTEIVRRRQPTPVETRNISFSRRRPVTIGQHRERYIGEPVARYIYDPYTPSSIRPNQPRYREEPMRGYNHYYPNGGIPIPYLYDREPTTQELVEYLNDMRNKRNLAKRKQIEKHEQERQMRQLERQLKHKQNLKKIQQSVLPNPPIYIHKPIDFGDIEKKIEQSIKLTDTEKQSYDNIEKDIIEIARADYRMKATDTWTNVFNDGMLILGDAIARSILQPKKVVKVQLKLCKP